jgi:hypothetical protein
VDIDLESRYRLRSLLMETLDRAPEMKANEWDGQRKP